MIQLNVSLQEQNARNQTLAEILLQVQCYFAANIEMLVEDNVYVVVSDTFTQMTVWLELKSHQEMLATTVWLENASIIESLNGHSKHDTFISLDTKQGKLKRCLGCLCLNFKIPDARKPAEIVEPTDPATYYLVKPPVCARVLQICI